MSTSKKFALAPVCSYQYILSTMIDTVWRKMPSGALD